MSSSRDQNFELIQLFAGNRSGGRGGVFAAWKLGSWLRVGEIQQKK